ncbi:unnamed protein product [Prorocentrum cordatum]|uniref:PNPLA domain-containing protein n=1 Tax=Prorocentrum cordatum TaxID=2364126 RepID=A0ABN9TZT7_9DINO|nr:unnamed protein product [Polarella glacialis]
MAEHGALLESVSRDLRQCHTVDDASGIATCYQRFTLWQQFQGMLRVAVVVTFQFPFLLLFTAYNTFAETSAALINLVGRRQRHRLPPNPAPTLVIPGTCAYIFWQLGMTQYICEKYDTSGARIVCTSSGASCAAMMLFLERAGSTREAVRAHARDAYGLIEQTLAPIFRHPMAFWGRTAPVLKDLLQLLVPEVPTPEFAQDAFPAEGGRVVCGLRRISMRPVPNLVAEAKTAFESREDFVAAAVAASNVFGVVSPVPCRVHRGQFCSDGVNPFSLYCFVDYTVQWITGRFRTTAPPHIINGDRRWPWNHVYSMWNVGIMDALLPTERYAAERLYWLTPTVGGHIQYQWALRFSGLFTYQQWTMGYRHARELDVKGYFKGLAPLRF